MTPEIPQDAADAAPLMICPAYNAKPEIHGGLLLSIKAQTTGSYRRLFRCSVCGLVFGISSAALRRRVLA